MQYFGGKSRIAKHLAKFIGDELKEGQAFADLFCGSCNVISQVKGGGVRIANDAHKELIAMHKAVQSGKLLPDTVSQDEYYTVKSAGEDWLKGFVGFGLSFSGKWWGGYARNSRGDDYCASAKNSLLKKHNNMRGVSFVNGSYKDCAVPDGSLLYCDIPYKETTQYSTGCFNHSEFYQWAEQMAGEGHTVLVSEYAHNVPDGWRIVWEHKSNKEIRNKEGVREATVEILMTPNKEHK